MALAKVLPKSFLPSILSEQRQSDPRTEDVEQKQEQPG